jgi:glycosyltransferase involved in cell wall biosynthesis
MPDREILFDLTEFLYDPQRSGIQRVCYEIVRHWPNASRLIPACVDERARLVALAPEVLDIYRACFQASAAELPVLKEQMQSLARRGRTVTARRFGRYHGLLNATVFSLPHQVEFYLWASRRGLSDRIFLFVHDVLLWTHPELFTPGFGANLIGYLRCLRALPNLAFNSEQTRTETLERVLRDGRQAGPACPLGAESLGTATPRFDPACRRFTVVSTIEPRKNHRAVLDAFDQLWSEGEHVELAFAGKLGWARADDRQRIIRLKNEEPLFHLLESLSDAQLVETIRGSRATIYPALHEGYGLPPVESLALGVPVIVTGSLPSVAMLSSEGQVRLASPTADQIVQAVQLMLDDAFAERKTDEIRRLRLPTWNAMAERLERWIENPRVVDSESTPELARAA